MVSRNAREQLELIIVYARDNWNWSEQDCRNARTVARKSPEVIDRWWALIDAETVDTVCLDMHREERRWQYNAPKAFRPSRTLRLAMYAVAFLSGLAYPVLALAGG